MITFVHEAATAAPQEHTRKRVKACRGLNVTRATVKQSRYMSARVHKRDEVILLFITAGDEFNSQNPLAECCKCCKCVVNTDKNCGGLTDGFTRLFLLAYSVGILPDSMSGFVCPCCSCVASKLQVTDYC